MRGPNDDATQVEDQARGKAAATDEARRRPPGGKPLVRLLQLLERSGYSDTAAATLATAVPPEDASAFREVAPQFTSAPNGAATPPRGARSKGAPEQPKTQPSEEIAAISAATAEHLTGIPTGTGPQWRSLGPWTIPNGQTYGSSRINVSGRVSALAIDPANPAHVLAGAANGGVWESRDRGASWAPRTDYQRTLTVGALAFDRTNSSRVYCGTGEGNWWSYLGNGVLRSTDGGTTWAVLCTAPFVGDGFYDLIVDPANGQRLIAGTRGGLWTSADGGVTWTRRRTQTTWSVAIAPAGGASAEILAACSDGLYRSTNGTTWTRVTITGTPATWDRLHVAIAPSNPTTAYIWGASGGTAYLYRRSGTTWTSAGAPTGVNVGQAWYDWFLAVAPDRDTQVYCGAIDAHRGDLSGTTWTWTNLSSKTSGSSIHPDQHAIAFEPGAPGTVYIGNDGGVYRSADRGINWASCNNGLQITEFEYLAQDLGTTRWIMGGTQDNGTERYTGSAIWDHIADGDGGDCGVNRQNPDTVFHTYYGMSPERSTTRGNFGSWAWLPPPVPSGEGSLFYPPFETSATSGDTVAIGGDALYVSRNNITNWTRIAFPSAARSSAMYIPNSNAVYVGTTDGRIYRTTWNGTSWTALTALTTPRANAYISDLFVDPRNVNRIWATSTTVGGGRVFRSDNAGTNWADRTGTLPALPITSIEVDPANANRVWVSADLGVYQTVDGGTNWTDFANGLPNAYVGDLIFHPHARVLRAGLRNRGVWEIPVDGWMTQPSCGVQFTGNLAGNQQGTWFTHSWPATWHVVWTVMPTTPRPGGPQVSLKVQVERANAEYATYWLTVKNLTPDPLSFEGRFCLLSRY